MFKVLILFLALVLITGEANTEWVKIIEKSITTPNDIVPITDSLVVPYVYTRAISLNQLPTSEKKTKFFEMLLPAILVAETEKQLTREKVIRLSKKPKLTAEEQAFISRLMAEYKAKTVQMLIARLHSFPVSIVLAQAAIESGWGTSRFFLQANNPFGIWSFNLDEKRIEASSHRRGEKIYLRKFDNLEQSIEAYYVMLASGPYSDFRAAMQTTSDPYKLCDYLIDYSERREEYVAELKNFIRANDLVKYDDYRIAPKYVVK